MSRVLVPGDLFVYLFVHLQNESLIHGSYTQVVDLVPFRAPVPLLMFIGQ